MRWLQCVLRGTATHITASTITATTSANSHIATKCSTITTEPTYSFAWTAWTTSAPSTATVAACSDVLPNFPVPAKPARLESSRVVQHQSYSARERRSMRGDVFHNIGRRVQAMYS